MRRETWQNVLGVMSVVLAFPLVQWAWFDHLSIVRLFGVVIGLGLAASWATRNRTGEWPRDLALEDTLALPREPRASGLNWLLACAAVAIVAWGYRRALDNTYWPVLGALLVSSMLWGNVLSTGEPPLSRRWLAWLTFAVIAVAAAFRFYKVGDIPRGLVHWDESLIYVLARQIVDGKREIFNIEGNDGQWPYWTNAAALWAFGNNIRGLRLSTAFSGLLASGLTMLLGRELFGRRVGLLAGAIFGMALWPVAFSRAEYILASSFVPVLGAAWLLLVGVRRGSALAFVFAGLCFGASVNVYNGAKMLPLMLPFLLAAVALAKPSWRGPLRFGLFPFAAGLLIALSPLILWYVHDPVAAKGAYFGKLGNDWIAGRDIIESHSFWQRARIFASRIIPNFKNVLPMYTVTGDRGGSWFFLEGTPLIDRTLLFLMLVGMSSCLARFRRPAYAFVFAWWFVGDLPALIATLQYFPSSRRIMMNLPATVLLSAIGLSALYDLADSRLRGSGNRLALVLAGGFFAWYLPHCWKAYFRDLNANPHYLSVTNANFCNGIRAVADEDARDPAYLISFRQLNLSEWGRPFRFRSYESHWSFLGKIPQAFAEADRNYFLNGGLFGSLERVPDAWPDGVTRTPLVLLTPFQSYLAPVLESLGGTRVAEVPVVQSTEGPEYTDYGFAPHDGKPVHVIYRLPKPSAAQLSAAKARYGYALTMEELIPPPGLGTRESFFKEPYNSPKVLAAHADLDAHPNHWKTGTVLQMDLPDPFFWVPGNTILTAPLRVKGQWELAVPSDGAYAFGGSFSTHTRVLVDDKEVFTYTPVATENFLAGEQGLMGAPVALTAGRHRIRVEQLKLQNDIENQALRLAWQPPGGKVDTIPLTNLYPLPVR